MAQKTSRSAQDKPSSEGQFMLAIGDMNLCGLMESRAKNDELFAFWHDELNDAWALAIGLASRD